MKLVAVFLTLGLLTSCSCDSSCESKKEIRRFLNSTKSHSEIIEFLHVYKGEAPGAEKYSAFVIWGGENTKEFVAIMNHEKITDRTIDLVIYKISDMGQSNYYCEIYKDLTKTANDRKIRDSLMGCKYGL
jgi:hypothetical protein